MEKQINIRDDNYYVAVAAREAIRYSMGPQEPQTALLCGPIRSRET